MAHFDDIHTLQQLDDRGLRIGTSSGSLRKVFGSMDNVFGERNYSSSVIKSLQSKYILINSSEPALDRVAYDGNVCCIERFADSKVRLSVSVPQLYRSLARFRLRTISSVGIFILVQISSERWKLPIAYH